MGVPRKIPLGYPWKGLHKGQAFTNQPADTSRELVNTLGRCPITGRIRGGSREGIEHFLSPAAAIIGPNVPVRRMETTVFNNRRLTYAFQSQPPLVWGKASDSAATYSSVVRTDVLGDVYHTDGDRAWVKRNAYGEVLWRQTVELGHSSHILTALWVDEDLSVYVGIGTHSGSFTPLTSAMPMLFKYVIDEEGTGYELAWSIAPSRFVPDLRVYQGILYTIQWDKNATTDDSYAVWYDDINLPVAPTDPSVVTSFVIPRASIWTVPAQDRNLAAHSLSLRTLGAIELVICGTDGGANGGPQARFICKMDSGGAILWKLTDGTGDASYQNGTGGIGFGCEVDSVGNVISLGYNSGAAGEGVWLRRLVDNGATVSTSGTGTWKNANVVGNVGYEYPRFVLDEFDNTYAPFCLSGTIGSATPRAVRVFSVAGTELVSAALFGTYAANAVCTGRATAIPPPGVPHRPAFAKDDSAKACEFVYVAASRPAATDPIAQKRRLLDVTHIAGSPRTFVHLALGGQDAKVFTPLGVNAPTNGVGALSSGYRYISTARSFGNIFIVDGVTQKYFDPVPTTSDPYGQILDWTSKTTGIIPPRARLVFPWRTRVGVSRTPDDPHNFYLSEAQNAFGWDSSKLVPTVGQAIVGNVTIAGNIPDLPNAFIPWSDDLLIVLCDHSIWRITGNPLKGAEIDRVSGVTGGSFGVPFCVDPEGRIFFHGNPGGIFALSPGGEVVRISTESIDEDLALINLETHYVELFWDDRRKGIHVLVFPFGATGTLLRHWFFERRTGAWIPQEYGAVGQTGVQPTAALVIDGDAPDDRRFLLAGEDGFVGMLASTARDDRGTPINASVLIGPVVVRQVNDDVSRINTLEITLAADQDGCGFDIYASDIPDLVGDPVLSGVLMPGFNRVNVRAKGRYLFVRLFSGEAGRRWAFESGAVTVYRAGRMR